MGWASHLLRELHAAGRNASAVLHLHTAHTSALTCSAQELEQPYAAYSFGTMQRVVDFQVQHLEAAGVANASSAPQVPAAAHAVCGT